MPHLLLMFNNNSLCLFHGVRFCDRVEVYSYACACLPSWTPHKVWVPSGVSVSRANVIIMRAAATKAKFKFILVTTEHLYSGSCSDSECYKQTMRVYVYKNFSIQDPPALCFQRFFTGNADMCLESSHTNLIVYLYKNAVIDYGLIS